MSRSYITISMLVLYNQLGVSETYPTSNLCQGENKLYIQSWRHLASGWYHQRSFTCGYIKNISDELSYEFHNDEDVWKLVKWTNFESQTKITLAVINETLQNLLLTKPSNYIAPPAESQRSPDSNSSTAILETNFMQEDAMESDEGSYNSEESGKSDVRLYYSKRCTCKKVALKRSQRSRIEFDRLDLHENLSKCTKLADYSKLLRKQYRKILNFWNISLEEMEDNINTTETLTLSEDVDGSDDSWIPEFYLSDNCQMIYYHDQYDQWMVDLEDKCFPFSSKLGLFISIDSAPCVEYLPPRGEQWWIGYHRVQDTDYIDDDDEVFEVCDSKFTWQNEDDFALFCISMEGVDE